MLAVNMLPESYKKTLCSIAKDGESTQYELVKATGLTYSPIHEAVEKLLILGLIRESKKEPGPGPSPKRYFSLSLRGLATAFRLLDPKDYCKMAEHWGFLLPLAWGKWEIFEKAGLRQDFTQAFKWVATWILEWGFDREDWATERFWYYVFQMTAGVGKVKWLKALRQDSELKQWAIDGLNDWIADGRIFMRMHKKTLEVLKMPEDPDWNQVTKNLRTFLEKAAAE